MPWETNRPTSRIFKLDETQSASKLRYEEYPGSANKAGWTVKLGSSSEIGIKSGFLSAI